jgi:hypothetical protein
VNPLTATPFQMQEVPEDFFVDIVSRNNFLVTSLTDLFEDIRAVDGIDPRLRKRAENFENYLRYLIRIVYVTYLFISFPRWYFFVTNGSGF